MLILNLVSKMYNINIPSSIKKKDNLLFEAHFNAETSTRFF